MVTFSSVVPTTSLPYAAGSAGPTGSSVGSSETSVAGFLPSMSIARYAYCVNVIPRIVGPLRSDGLPWASRLVRSSAMSKAVISTSLSFGSAPM